MFKSVEGQVVFDSTTKQAWVILDAGSTIWNDTISRYEPGLKLALGDIYEVQDITDLWLGFQWTDLRDGNGAPFPTFFTGLGLNQKKDADGNYIYQEFTTEQLNQLLPSIGFLHRIGPDKVCIVQTNYISSNSNEQSVDEEYALAKIVPGGYSTDVKQFEDGYTAIPKTTNPTRFGYKPAYGQADLEARANILAQEIIKREAEEKNRIKQFGSIFTTLSSADDIIDNQQTIISNGLFSTNSPTLSKIFTSSLQPTESKPYYYEAWDLDSATTLSAEPQFSIAYGNRLGSGSSAEGTLNDSPSRAVYSQYKLLLLEPGDTTFNFKDGTSSDSIYAINFNRDKLKEKLDPGNWQLTLAQLSGSTVPNNSHTGSNVKIETLNPSFISLIDDSGDYYNVQGISGAIFNVVSGSLVNGIYNPSAPHYYGLVYPNVGTVILNDKTLNQSCSFNSVTGSNTAGDNAWKLFTSISGAMSTDPINYTFQAKNVETVSSTHYFIRVKNGEYNFSNNPTYVTGSNGDIAQATFINDPKTYITTVGLYNTRQELLAVGKLSKAIQKSYNVETLIKVKLDY